MRRILWSGWWAILIALLVAMFPRILMCIFVGSFYMFAAIEPLMGNFWTPGWVYGLSFVLGFVISYFLLGPKIERLVE